MMISICTTEVSETKWRKFIYKAAFRLRSVQSAYRGGAVR